MNFLYQGAEKHWVSASASDTRAVWDVIKVSPSSLYVTRAVVAAPRSPFLSRTWMLCLS